MIQQIHKHTEQIQTYINEQIDFGIKEFIRKMGKDPDYLEKEIASLHRDLDKLHRILANNILQEETGTEFHYASALKKALLEERRVTETLVNGIKKHHERFKVSDEFSDWCGDECSLLCQLADLIVTAPPQNK